MKKVFGNYFVRILSVLIAVFTLVNTAAVCFADDEAVLSGWQEKDGKTYYYEAGVPAAGFLEDDGKTYYLNEETGVMESGWQDIDGSKYYFDKKGVMQTGWYVENGDMYFLGDDGKMLTGWQKVDGKDRYFDKDGILQTGETYIKDEGKTYYLFEDGGFAAEEYIGDAYYGSSGNKEDEEWWNLSGYMHNGVFTEFSQSSWGSRLYVPDVGVDVGLNYVWDDSDYEYSQGVVDAWDSAAYMPWGNSPVIGDHKHQGFEAIKGCKPGMKAFVKTGDALSVYEVFHVGNGVNDEINLYDDFGRDLFWLGDGILSLYTCNEGWWTVTVVEMAGFLEEYSLPE